MQLNNVHFCLRWYPNYVQCSLAVGSFYCVAQTFRPCEKGKGIVWGEGRKKREIKLIVVSLFLQYLVKHSMTLFKEGICS